METIARSVGRYEPGGETPGTPLPVIWPEPLDLSELAQRTPQRPQFVMSDWFPAGYATLLAGHGGVGKSGIALHLAVCIAFGRGFFGLSVEQRRVLYLSCEDREDILHWRLSRICAYLGVSMTQLAGWLDILDLVGRDSILWGWGGVGWWLFLIVLALLAGWVWAYFMWLALENDIRRISSDSTAQKVDEGTRE